ncbi:MULTISPECIES: hypothetical protein [unclassified Pseudomonas]|uniref:hypothetical protein n=1 Tax=unclassified Pseudomonas TaxID=196821 RepID=UPI002AC9B7F5|nr:MULTISPECIES: hypothetical protein [unclassified Pseudomonas]MEB0045185.1 hypothetical protein [Pseudomonas sp. Dout3]MEB0096459.1 hypothetical protein [Pseudomonas sp. DC1.2]WPX61411.1 hypothetical protein RHM68_12480 [Pseudomonas sp. DC1.2]
MNRCVLGCTVWALSGLLGQAAQAQSPTSTSNNNPYNSPIHRANPNSMQGTQPNAPAIPQPTFAPVPRPPTVENGGVGNRYPQGQTAPAAPPKFIPNPPPRDSDNSNR